MALHSLVAFGSNSCGQCGPGHVEDLLEPTTVISTDSRIKIKTVSCGGNHTLLLTTEGLILATGRQDEGQVNGTVSLDPILTFQPISLPENYLPITSITAGWHSSFALSSEGVLLHWGSDQVFDPKSKDITITPTPVLNAPKSVTAASAGWKHLAVVSDGAVWCIGNNRHGELGVGHTNTVTDFTRVTLPTDTGAAVVVECGWFHTCALTEAHEVFAWGRGRHGQLGDIGDDKMSSSPVKVQLPCRPQELKSGWTHCCVTDEEGRVWVWGRGDYGQTGDRGDTSTPSLVIGRPKDDDCTIGLDGPATCIASGSEHLLALTSQGSILAWGWGEHGQLGHGVDNQSQPVTVPKIEEGTVVAVYAGAGHSMVVLQH